MRHARFALCAGLSGVASIAMMLHAHGPALQASLMTLAFMADGICEALRSRAAA